MDGADARARRGLVRAQGKEKGAEQ
jgi:hypothetical protein